MNTIELLKNQFPVGDLEHLMSDAEIPVLTGPNSQGDLSWYPINTDKKIADLEAIPANGKVVLEGNNGHPHTLFSMTGECFISISPSQGQLLGTVVIPEGSVLLVGHNEHGYNAVGAGTYLFNRSREMREEIELLAD